MMTTKSQRRVAPDMKDRTPEQRQNAQSRPPEPMTLISAPDGEVNGRILLHATYHPLPCGCTVTGDGSLPFPLTVIPCYGDHRELRLERDALEAEIQRLRGWLMRIDGGDHPERDASILRQWAYEAVTLGKQPDEI